jgi:RNA polymerase sigma-70 factor (ECF subfamily)
MEGPPGEPAYVALLNPKGNRDTYRTPRPRLARSVNCDAVPRVTPSGQGFEEHALPHFESVAAFALSLTRNEADADDLVQETFLQAFRGWHTFTPGTDCRRWLFTICRHAFIRMRSRKPPYVESDEGDLDAMPTAIVHMQAARDGLTDVVDWIEVRPAIERAVEALPEPHHSVLVLVDVEGHSYEEAAAVLAIPVGTVRSRLYRARRHVQEALLVHARDMGLRAHTRRKPEPGG